MLGATDGFAFVYWHYLPEVRVRLRVAASCGSVGLADEGGFEGSHPAEIGCVLGRVRQREPDSLLTRIGTLIDLSRQGETEPARLHSARHLCLLSGGPQAR